MVAGLQAFLKDHPLMTINPGTGANLVIEGKFHFSAHHKGKSEITDCYDLRIDVPQNFPRDLPCVTELAKKIPHNERFHVNSDATLCLGSPLRLLQKLSQQPTLPGFASLCLIPYLYAVSYKLRFGGEFIFSELAHGPLGEIQDYLDLFSLKTPEQVRRVLRVLGMKKRRANKEPCPCYCGKRLGRCRFNSTILQFRKLASRPWFRAHQV